eukprot:GILK01008394.1.p1 GENE.GILK01008394.1~~GILK01008394.1.p1  ORF type:complete len:180 (-),score=11.48 GILK01008394.1:165-641(-)
MYTDFGNSSYKNDRLLTIATAAAGVLFAVGWLLFIDGAAYATYTDDKVSVNFVCSLPAIGITLVFFMINLMDWGQLSADHMTYHGENVALKARAFLVFTSLAALSCLFGALYVFVTRWVHPHEGDPSPDSLWPGIAIVLQAFFVLISGLVYRLVQPDS